jgi:regulator of protease activity HflC (stomatin/prohibitin superfamily)
MPLNCLLPEASLKDVISEIRRVIAERGVTVPAKKATARKATAKKATAKKATAKRATAKKAKKATAKKTSARVSSQPGRTPARRAATPSRRASTLAAPGRSGDLIVIDSPQVGSPPREGEVLEVMHGEVSVSYRVRWGDGHETLITPKSGIARIVRASTRA